MTEDSKKASQTNERQSRLIQEIDELMVGDPLSKNSRGGANKGGYQTTKSKHSVAQSDSFTYMSMGVAGERSGKSSHYMKTTAQPLIEIRQNEAD